MEVPREITWASLLGRVVQLMEIQLQIVFQLVLTNDYPFVAIALAVRLSCQSSYSHDDFGIVLCICRKRASIQPGKQVVVMLSLT